MGANAAGTRQRGQGNGRQHPSIFIQEIFQKQFSRNLYSIAAQ
ncbi:MAG: hypothetical protein ACYDCX_06595 [Acidithiobacillus sp.]